MSDTDLPNASKRCVECAENIEASALKCRHCGSYQRKTTRWMGPLVTILSLLIALISLVISSADTIYELAFPRSALFATVEEFNEGRANLILQNESSDSVVVEGLACYLKTSPGDADHHYLETGWGYDVSSIVPPSGSFQFEALLLAAYIVEREVDEKLDAPLPQAETEVIRFYDSGCDCDEDEALSYESRWVTIPATVCRIRFRSSRQEKQYYDFNAPALDLYFNELRNELLAAEPDSSGSDDRMEE